MKIIGKEHIAGKFFIRSGSVKIGDPCYPPDTWCLGSCDDVLDGAWKVKIFRADDSQTKWGPRNTALFAFNEMYFENNFGFDDIEVERFVNGAHRTQFCLKCSVGELGVDSGQAGIYDEQHYIKMREEDKKKDRTDSWYWTNNSEITLYNDLEAGVTPDKMGCVSSSGYGDGCYDYYCYYNEEGYTVAILIVFIEGDEDDE